MTVDERSGLLARNEQQTYNAEVNESGESNGTNVQSSRGPGVRMATIVPPLGMGIFLGALDQTIVASSLASIGNELKELQNTSWVATTYMLTLASFQPFFGKLSDIFGRKECLLFGYCTFALGCLMCGLSRNLSQLVFGRGISGLGAAATSTVVTILLSDLVPLRDRGTWQGIINIIHALGAASGASLGGIIADSIGWRWTFLIRVPPAILAVTAIYVTLHLPPREVSDMKSKLKRIDFLGAFLLFTSILTLLMGLNRGGNISWSDRTTVIELLTSAVSLVLFLVVEIKVAPEPFAPKTIMFNRLLIPSYLCNFFGVAAHTCMVYELSLYIQAAMNASAARAGASLLPGVITSVVGSLSSGIIMQRSGKYYWLTAFVYFCMVAGSLAITLFSGGLAQSMVIVITGWAVLAFGFGAGLTTTLVSLIANTSSEDQAMSIAASYLFRSLGSVIGVSVGSSLVQNTLRSDLYARLPGDEAAKIVPRVIESLDYLKQLDPVTGQIVREVYGRALRVSFWFCVGLSATSLLCSAFISERPLVKKNSTEE